VKDPVGTSPDRYVHYPDSEIMGEIKPMHAIARHLFNEPDTSNKLYKKVHGPLTVARDMLVWNIAGDNSGVRRSAFPLTLCLSIIYMPQGVK